MSQHPGWVLAVCVAASLSSAGPQKASPTPIRWPRDVIRIVPGADRFENPDYFRFFAADGLRAASPETIFTVMASATERREYYKALYLARILTATRPDLPAAWTNRSKLAAQLGLDDE